MVINKSDKRKLLKLLEGSKQKKIAKGWSREAGAGFIKEDVKEVQFNPSSKRITLYLYDEPPYGHRQTFMESDLNLRETEELISYLK